MPAGRLVERLDDLPMIVAAMIAISLIPGAGRAGLPVGIALGLMAYRVYVQHAIGALSKARLPDGMVDPQEIARAGVASALLRARDG